MYFAAAIAALLTICGMFGCGGGRKEDVEPYAKNVSALEIPAGVRIAALGEASHGNNEFQKLKLTVLQKLVEKTDIRAMGLEADFGGCAIANAYIAGNAGTAEDAVRSLGFQIYRTDNMLELVKWMHDYNMEAAPEEKVRLYGFDSQRFTYSGRILGEFYRTLIEKDFIPAEQILDYSKATTDLKSYFGEETYANSGYEQADEFIHKVQEDLKKNEEAYKAFLKEYRESVGNDSQEPIVAVASACDEREAFLYLSQAAEGLRQYMAIRSSSQYNQTRDKYMAENVQMLLDHEENVYGRPLMLSAHNGHVAKIVNSSYTNMGSYLHDKYDDAYYVIGTDYYETVCSLPTDNGREDFSFCSDDPVAKALTELEGNEHLILFGEVDATSKLYGMIHGQMKTGSLGEGYSPMMKIMKSTHQINFAPTQLYDAMIFVDQATPIRVWD